MDCIGELIALGIDSLILGAAIRLYVKWVGVKNALKEIKVYDVSELKDALEAQSDNKISYAAVHGTVRSIGAPMHSLNDPDVTAVVQRLRMREHLIARGTSGFWTNHNRLIQDVINYVPFVIYSQNQCAEVLDPLGADVLDMFTIADKFEPASISVADHLWGWLMGVRQRGLQSTEEVLKEGNIITCIGEVTSSKDGSLIQLQRPSSGYPYFITTSPVSSVIHRLQDNITRYKVVISVSGAIGAGILCVVVYRWWKKWSEILKKEERHRLQEAAKEARRLQTGTGELPENQLCVVCCDCLREVIVFPCGHFCMCEDCSDKINTNCPICRTAIGSKSHAYF